ncbi:hypothetical protein ACJ73_09964 [Blastomyces percursus]|uniref:Uncharacterized protein n=1 Tax=Blastomyces percursus TaxID=1658174 RepID=A0A1J9PQB7_9EURO|nr:hypothetical protein ACJ73_09964 [Blastomyces percursus]
MVRATVSDCKSWPFIWIAWPSSICESKWGGPWFRIADRGPSMQAPQQTD